MRQEAAAAAPPTTTMTSPAGALPAHVGRPRPLPPEPAVGEVTQGTALATVTDARPPPSNVPPFPQFQRLPEGRHGHGPGPRCVAPTLR